MLKFEVKFANFIHRDPYLENANLTLLKFIKPGDALFEEQSYVATYNVQWGWWGFCVAALVTASRRGRVCLRQLRVRSSTQRKRALYLASLRSLPSPYGLEIASLVAAQAVSRPPPSATQEKLEFTIPLPRNSKFNPKFSRQIYSKISDATHTVAMPTIPIIKVSIV